jgi:PKD domain
MSSASSEKLPTMAPTTLDMIAMERNVIGRGRLVAFNGSATAPGSDDQATLTYSWDFGDGTPPTAPSASGGSGVFHSYTTPGMYIATLAVTNEDGQSASASRTVTIVTRTVTVGYLGDTAGTYDTQGALSASLVDQYGSTVNGRLITFTVGGPAGSAVTNSSGIGSTAFTPLLDAGSYTTTATFAGDPLYVGNSGSGNITIARKASMTTYTGALSGGPNKTVTLSATLVDATGKALSGRTIVFQLGSQPAVTALTNASGVATTSIKLIQKNGKYPLTATWTPAGADANHYLGSVASTTFSLQAK